MLCQVRNSPRIFTVQENKTNRFHSEALTVDTNSRVSTERVNEFSQLMLIWTAASRGLYKVTWVQPVLKKKLGGVWTYHSHDQVWYISSTGMEGLKRDTAARQDIWLSGKMSRLILWGCISAFLSGEDPHERPVNSFQHVHFDELIMVNATNQKYFIKQRKYFIFPSCLRKNILKIALNSL